MTFLAMTPLHAAMLAIATIGAVVALYFLRVRRRKVLVSSAILWRRILEQHFAQSLWQRFRLIFSILLALTISLLIALSIARPQIEWLTGKPRRIVIVLDTSPSMNTRTADGSTRWLHAVAKARALIENAGPSDEVRLTETSGDTAFGFTASRAEADKIIDQLSPKNIEPRFPILDGNESHVYFISDGVALHDVPPHVESISVFETAHNVGITAFDIRSVPSDPLEYEAYLEVDNFGEATTIGVTLSGSGQDRITTTLPLAAKKKYRESFNLSSFKGGPVHASILSKDDALPLDDQAIAYLPTRRKIRTLVVTQGNPRLLTLLKYDRNVELSVVDPQNYEPLPDIDAYVFDRFAPTTQPSKPAFILGSSNGARVVQKPRITSWSERHPIMQHVAMEDVSIQAVTKIDPKDLTVIAASNDTPLILASENPRRVMLAFDLGSSDFPGQAGFPIFVHNVLTWLVNERPAIHAANPIVFNVNQSTLSDEYATLRRESRLHHELWFYMLAGAVLLIGIEWITYHRRITL